MAKFAIFRLLKSIISN